MNIIGLSGVPRSVAFKRAQWPGLDEREYRICQGFDAAAVLVQDGRIIAASAEERYTNRKHTGEFPVNAIKDCLQQASLGLDDIDQFAHAFNYEPYDFFFKQNTVSSKLYDEVLSKAAIISSAQEVMPDFPGERLVCVNHHLSHAASAYFASGWNECLVVILDGMGEVYGGSVYSASNGKLDLLHEIPSIDSIGILYSLITLHLGFDFGADEYKIMGLAPYGDAARFEAFFSSAVELLANASIRIPMLAMNHTREERETYQITRNYLDDNLLPARKPGAPLLAIHQDVAAGLQKCLERAVRHICSGFADSTGHRKLAMAGGVALNCTSNGKLMRSGLFEDIFIQPAAGDDGAAAGAALFCAAMAKEVFNERMPVPFLGPSYSSAEIEQAIEVYRQHITVQQLDTHEACCESAADKIAEGKIIAWCRGRMEFGPRALGNRCILGNPGDPTMRDRINALIKKREAFRPFAPAVSIEQASKWFDVPPQLEFPYMIATANVRPEYRKALPAVTHVDGSARIQTVSAHDNKSFHALLRVVGKKTGRELVLNTSFNVKGQPMVNTPVEAISTMLDANIDALYLENYLICRKS